MGSRNNKPGRIVKGTALQPSLKSASGVWSLDEAMQAHRANAWPQPNLFQPVANSLRLDGSRNTFLSRTISRSGNRQTWTWSGWFKPSTTGGSQYLFVSTNTNGNPFTYVYFSEGAFRWWDNNGAGTGGAVLNTNAIYRDTSAWYHVVLAVDTTQATESNRAKLYINGVQVTSFTATSYPLQGEATYTNSGAPGENVAYISAPPGYVYGYLAEVNFVDGYQLNPSLLGKFDTNNTWVPVPYTGSYGTNGFYLPFNNATTSQTLGYDASLNGTTTYDTDQDPYRGNVALHLTGNGPAGGNNNTITDSSTNNRAITRVGVTQGSFSPFPMQANAPYNPSVHGASAYFNGSSDYLSIASDPSIGTQDFTIECWVYANSTAVTSGSNPRVFDIGGAQLVIEDTGRICRLDWNNSSSLYVSNSNVFQLNQWIHIAAVRISNVVSFYLNGVAQLGGSNSDNLIGGTGYIGSYRGGTSGFFNGYISGLRFTIGKGIYTAAFTPTNRPFGTLTNNLLNFSEDFANSVWTGQSAVVGLTTNAAIAPDGTPSATLLVPSTSSAGQNIAGIHDSAAGVNTFSIYAKSAGYRYMQCFHSRSAGGDAGYVTFDLTTGAVTNSSVWSGSIVNVGNGWYRIIATTSSLAGASANSNVRWAITDGSASRAPVFTGDGTSGIYVWGAQAELASSVGNYTPTPANFRTAPSLLLNFANAAVVDSAGAGNIVTVSNATVTSSAKYGSGAMTFNGSSDYFQSSWSLSSFLSPGSNNWTLETWVYMTKSLSSAQVIVGYGYESGSTRSFVWYYNGDGTFRLAQSPDGSTNYDAGFGSPQGGFALNTWYHLAIVRNSGAMTMYVNGKAMPNTLSAYTISSISTGYFRIGVESSTYFGGSMDDLRYTKGVARYTTDFAPPARSLPEVGGKSFVTTNVNAGVVRSFTTTGTTSWTAPVDVTSVEVLVVAGGGGGANYNSAGGGGAGGLIYNNSYPVTPGTVYTVTVGAGGAGGGTLGAVDAALGAATSGGNSVFGALVAIGGGNGGQGNVQGSRSADQNPGTGGSGGGARGSGAPGNAGAAGTAGQGFAGGNSGAYDTNYPGGGGGGAGGPGGAGVGSTTGGNGGVGLQFGISGTTAYYAGGGGGSTQGSGTTTSGGLGGGGAGGGGSGGAFATGVSGTANTGGGGGAGGYNGTTGSGGNGGSGIVVVRYTTTAVGNTSDVTTDNLVDSPTLYGHDTGAGGEVVGNYCTWSPLPVVNYGDGVSYKSTLSNGNLTATYGTNFSWAYGSIGIPNNAKTYIEYTVNSYTSTGNGWIGFSDVASIGVYFGVTVNGSVYIGNGSYNVNDSPGFATGDILGFAVDRIGNTLTLYKNGSQVYNVALAYGITSSTVLLPAVWTRAPGDRVTLNAGQRPWAYAPPAGFTALTTKNFARLTAGTPAANPNQYFDTVTYTGTGATQSITGLNFQPDFVWIKNRSTASYGHKLYDVIRGVYNQLETNDTGAETVGASNSFASFNSNGFTLGPYAGTNGSTNNLVAWCWKAGGAAVANTAGAITSQVSANTASGFSIVTYSGNGSASATIGHGLGATPAMVITKVRNGTDDWRVWHQSMFQGDDGSGHMIRLNTTAASAYDSQRCTGGTSTTFRVIGNASPFINASGSNYVAYVWTEIPGFSRFGSHTGNGSADGTFVYLGFRPRFIMTKRTDSTGDWLMVDTARDTFNPTTKYIIANSAGAEGTATIYDITSNGFKLRLTTDPNISTSTVIWAAFADKPFGNVNGVAR